MLINPSANDFGSKLVKILGLPDQTIWFELRCAVDEIVSVKGQFYVSADSEEIIEFFNDYEIVKKNDGMKGKA